MSQPLQLVLGDASPLLVRLHGDIVWLFNELLDLIQQTRRVHVLHKELCHLELPRIIFF